MGWLTPLVENVTVFVVLLLYISQSFCYEIHIQETDKAGTTVFNGSIGQDWTYSLINRHRSGKGDLKVVSLDTYSGILYLSKNPKCVLLHRNPIQFHISASRKDSNDFVNTAQFPVQLFVHGKTCAIKHRRKSGLTFLPFGTHLLSTQINQNFGSCIEKDTLLLDLKNYFPLYWKDCMDKFRLHEVPFFEVERSSGFILSSDSFCFELPFHLLQGSFQVSSSCSGLMENRYISYQLMLYSNDSLSNPLVEDLARSIGETKQRLRREVNNPPYFEQRLFVKSVAEEQNPGVVIDTITAKDPDSGPEGTLTYSLIANEDQRSQFMFTIDEISGQLKTTQVLDRESFDKHSFTVKVVDGGSPPLSAEATLQIHVDDINDHSPEFESPSYTRYDFYFRFSEQIFKNFTE